MESKPRMVFDRSFVDTLSSERILVFRCAIGGVLKGKDSDRRIATGSELLLCEGQFFYGHCVTVSRN